MLSKGESIDISKQPPNEKDIKCSPAINQGEAYDNIGQYIAEIYDKTETYLDDITLIKLLIGDRPTKILEPFCGHGRILIPLAQAGYNITGMDISHQFLQCLDSRLRQLPAEIRSRAEFRQADVIAEQWPCGFDVVLLGGNCLYELATPEEQESCIQAASSSLVQGGYLYLDNNHMEGDLDPTWYQAGIREGVFPTGQCRDGTQINGTTETIWYDASRRLVRFRRTVTIKRLEGDIQKREWIQQKHPPSTEEMSGWLMKHGFTIEGLWGNRSRSSYSAKSNRAIFWASKV